ncbi:MAG: hypothetical protein IPN83_03485 [Holophagales bacterium]|nr:hypothetical protein [Holophagales bacterium]
MRRKALVATLLVVLLALACPVVAGEEPIVFVTAFDQFAVEAFRLHALDYLTKPIDPGRFSESLDRVREYLKPQNQSDPDQRIQARLDLHGRRQAVRPHLVVREQVRHILVPTAGIHALEATGNYFSLHCDRASYLL